MESEEDLVPQTEPGTRSHTCSPPAQALPQRKPGEDPREAE